MQHTTAAVAASAFGLISSDRPRTLLREDGQRPALDAIWQLLDTVPDPEVPVISVVELGIVRQLNWQQDRLVVTLTPTYSGCPATQAIADAIHMALWQAGLEQIELQEQLSPAWTTDWISPAGRDKLRAYGIAPPAGSASKRTLLGEEPEVHCPHCGSVHTSVISEFGSTACKALYRCDDCREPFDYFKCI
ncbi:phenylacetate-CoA oxygenase subunit PaaJ [Pokkaliibacter plantistimulans]|uniref:Phenylacetate-CoA oxygenase subunit PaaJ n=1 Tax=Proteobacteria bacterium 228 TaxID=2083153 RepID=A0A2S5KN16_9PROT|nr:1,2-phenylacetyl-CoA epoxidase subunit PaaD [Pokkaliibacter plantistimulans]PPC76130.1 phenylacetate-CoA oxygenase subunit PaaJ [Pokkaliibacter plantistimulans]